MKKSLPQIQYSRLMALYHKLQARLNRNFTTGRFRQFTRTQQQRLLHRIDKLKNQLLLLERGLQLAGTTLALTAVLHTNQAKAQLTPVSSEMLVNTHTSDSQLSPTVAQDASGNFVVTWVSEYQDGDGYGIYAQRYNAAGAAQGSEFRVNTYTTSNQNLPQIGMDNSGNFVITWESKGQDGDDYGIYAQRYNASGVAQGSEFRVSTTATGVQSYPAIAMDGAGDFVIAWTNGEGAYPSYDVFAQRYNASGVAQGSEFIVNTTTTGNQQNPEIDMDDSGDFVMVWEDDYLNRTIKAKQYTAAGAGGSEFQVNTSTASDQTTPDIAVDGNGDFIVTWEIYAQDGSDDGIFAQRFNSTAVKQGAEFQVNTYTTGNQFQPYIAANKNSHDFVITWISGGEDGDSYGVYAQRFDATGAALGSEFQVNTYTSNQQDSPVVSLDNNGDLIIAWQSYGQDQYYDVYLQRYTDIVTATQNQSAVSLFNMFPNPAKDQVQLSYDGNDVVQVKVMNMSGTLISEQSVSDKTVHIEGLKAGVYLLEITKDGAATERKKLVIE